MAGPQFQGRGTPNSATGGRTFEQYQDGELLAAGTNPSATELADMVRARVPGAQIDFQPGPSLQFLLTRLTVRFDGRWTVLQDNYGFFCPLHDEHQPSQEPHPIIGLAHEEYEGNSESGQSVDPSQ